MTDIEKLRNLLNLTQEAFAAKLGVSSRTIQNWEAGKVVPKSKIMILGQMAAKFPNVSFSMFEATDSPGTGNGNEDGISLVPLIHIDSVGGMRSLNKLSSSEQYVERMVPFPDARPDDVAILQSGNSMAPTIPAGAILQIRRVDGWREYFGYGNDFVLWLDDDRRITKQVLKYEPDPKNYVTCHSYNLEAADEELPKSMIKEVWKVINVLINKGW